MAAPTWAISLTGPSRSRRAVSEPSSVVGIASGGSGPTVGKLITCILKQARFQHRLREFLDEQRNPIRLADDLRVHFRGQGPLSGHVEYHGLDLLAPEPVKPQHGYVRLIEPLREELRPEAHQDEYLRRFD